MYRLVQIFVGAKLKGGFGGDLPLQSLISQGRRIFAGQSLKSEEKPMIAEVYFVTVCHLVPSSVASLTI